MTKRPNKGNLRRKMCFGLQFKGAVNCETKALWQELEIADHMASIVRKQREMDAGV